MLLTTRTITPIHNSLFYICSLLFVVLFLEVEDKFEASLHISTFEPLPKEVKILKRSFGKLLQNLIEVKHVSMLPSIIVNLQGQ